MARATALIALLGILAIHSCTSAPVDGTTDDVADKLETAVVDKLETLSEQVSKQDEPLNSDLDSTNIENEVLGPAPETSVNDSSANAGIETNIDNEPLDVDTEAEEPIDPTETNIPNENDNPDSTKKIFNQEELAQIEKEFIELTNTDITEMLATADPNENDISENSVTDSEKVVQNTEKTDSFINNDSDKEIKPDTVNSNDIQPTGETVEQDPTPETKPLESSTDQVMVEGEKEDGTPVIVEYKPEMHMTVIDKLEGPIVEENVHNYPSEDIKPVSVFRPDQSPDSIDYNQYDDYPVAPNMGDGDYIYPTTSDSLPPEYSDIVDPQYEDMSYDTTFNDQMSYDTDYPMPNIPQPDIIVAGANIRPKPQPMPGFEEPLDGVMGPSMETPEPIMPGAMVNFDRPTIEEPHEYSEATSTDIATSNTEKPSGDNNSTRNVIIIKLDFAKNYATVDDRPYTIRKPNIFNFVHRILENIRALKNRRNYGSVQSTFQYEPETVQSQSSVGDENPETFSYSPDFQSQSYGNRPMRPIFSPFSLEFLHMNPFFRKIKQIMVDSRMGQLRKQLDFGPPSVPRYEREAPYHHYNPHGQQDFDNYWY